MQVPFLSLHDVTAMYGDKMCCYGNENLME